MDQKFPPKSALRALSSFRLILDGAGDLADVSKKHLDAVAGYLRSNNYMVAEEGEDSDAVVRVWLAGTSLELLGHPDKMTIVCAIEVMTTVKSAPNDELFIVFRDVHTSLSVLTQLDDTIDRILRVRTAGLVTRLNESRAN